MHDEEAGVVRELRGMRLVDHRGGGAVGEGRSHEVVAVVLVAPDGEVELARLDGAAVDRDAGDGLRESAAHTGLERRHEAQA